MALHTVGVNLELQGEREYRDALKAIGMEQKELRSEMQLSQAVHAEDRNSLEALQEQYDILSKQIDSQKDKIEVYEKTLEAAREKQKMAADSVEEYAQNLDSMKKEMDEMKASGNATDEMLEEQQKKIDEAEGALRRAQQAYQDTSKSVDMWQTGLNVAQAQLVEMDKDLEKTGKYLNEAKESTDGCAKSINQFGEELKETEKESTTFGEVLKANLASGAIVAGMAALVNITKEAGEALYSVASDAAFLADEINTLSTQTGIATDTIQALKYSEELLDVSVETVTSAMAKNIRSMQQAASGSEKYVEAYDKLGISVTEANGELRDSETVFWEMIDALGKIDNATERDAIAMQVFGRNAQSLNTLIKAGSSGFQEMYQEADKLGYILDKNTLDGLNRTSDAIERVSKTADAIKNQIGADVAPVIETAAEDIRDLMLENADKIEEVIADVIPDIVDGLQFVVENLDVIIPAVEGVVTGFLTFKAATAATAALNAVMAVLPPLLESATVEQLALNAAQAISPMGAVAAAAGLLVTGLSMLCASAKEYTPKVYELSEEERKLVDSMNAVNDAANTHRDTFSQNVETMAANRSQAQELIGKLRELEPQAKNDASAMDEMQQVVGQLNTLMPNLGLSINGVTGELNMGIDSIESYTDALMHQIEVDAYSERLTEILQDQVDIRTQMIELEDAYTAAVEENNAAYAERNRAEEEYRQALSDLENDVEGSSTMIVDNLRQQYEAAQEATEETVMGNSEITESYNGLKNTYDQLSEEYETYQELLADTAPQEAASAANEQLTTTWRGYIIPVVGDTNEKLEELSQKYDEAYRAAQNSLESQMGLFQEFKAESQSLDAMTASLNSQTEQMTQYGENLQKALDLGVDPSVIASIEELGIQGAGYLEEVVKAAEAAKEGNSAALDSFLEAWSGYQESMSNLSSEMAEFEVLYGETMGNIVTTATESDEAMLEGQTTFAEDYVQSWSAMGEDTAAAIEEMKPVISEDVTLVAAAAVSSLNTELGIDDTGRSSKGFQAGQQFGQSIADGVEAMEPVIVEKVAKVGRAAVAEAEEWARKIDEALGENL